MIPTLPSAASMVLVRLSETSRSEGETPSHRIGAVADQQNALVPSLRKRASSVSGPGEGSRSIFQSPVWMTVPSGVLITSGIGSGEWNG